MNSLRSSEEARRRRLPPVGKPEDCCALPPRIVGWIEQALIVEVQPLPKCMCTARELLRYMLETMLHDINTLQLNLANCQNLSDRHRALRLNYDYLQMTELLDHSDIVQLCKLIITQRRDFYLMIDHSGRKVEVVSRPSYSNTIESQKQPPLASQAIPALPKKQVIAPVIDVINERQIKLQQPIEKDEFGSMQQVANLIDVQYNPKNKASNLQRKQKALPLAYQYEYDTEQDNLLLEMAEIHIAVPQTQAKKVPEPTQNEVGENTQQVNLKKQVILLSADNSHLPSTAASHRKRHKTTSLSAPRKHYS